MNFWQVLKEKLSNALRARDNDVGRNDDECRCFHSFAAQRERAVSDLRRIAVLEQEITLERGRASDSDASDPILRESAIVISAAKRVGLYCEGYKAPGTRISLRTGESVVFIDPIIGFKKPAKEVISSLIGI